MSSDVKDILSIEDTGSKKQNFLDKDALLNNTDKKVIKKTENVKRPRNIPRELWGLKDTFGGDFPSILPAPEVQIYKQPKALITGKVRSWLWTGFKNSARKDGLVLSHWKRADLVEKEQDYYFAQFNKKPVLPLYTNSEYEEHLDIEEWSRAETDYLMSAVEKYDMRFILVHDQWDRTKFTVPRTVEDIKERYYMILNTLNNLRCDAKPTADPRYGPGSGWGVDTSCLVFHAEHEKRRKHQLEKLLARTTEQIAEEEELSRALHRIEILKRERQKKTMDLHKLLSQADFAIRGTTASEISGTTVVGGTGNSGSENHIQQQQQQLSALGGELIRTLSSTSQSRKKSNAYGNMLQTVGGNVIWEGLKFHDLSKNPGVHLRSAEMKLPASIGIKKTRFIEGLLGYFNIDSSPIAIDDIVDVFNNLRCDILLIQELYATLSHLEYDLCSYREKYKKLIDSGVQIDSNKSVPTCLTTPHIPFASSPHLQLGPSLQAAIRAAEVKQKTTITPLNVVHSSTNSGVATSGFEDVSPPGTRNSIAASNAADSPRRHHHHHHRKRKRLSTFEEKGVLSPPRNSADDSEHVPQKKSIKKFRMTNNSSSTASLSNYMVKKRP